MAFCTFFTWRKCKCGCTYPVINTLSYVNIPCYYPHYENYEFFCEYHVYHATLLKPGYAGKKAITSKYIKKELSTIILKYHAVLLHYMKTCSVYWYDCKELFHLISICVCCQNCNQKYMHRKQKYWRILESSLIYQWMSFSWQHTWYLIFWD